MPFSDIVGHERCLSVLRKALDAERLPHAYLFCGPERVGKTTTALAFAQAANCTSTGPRSGASLRSTSGGENGAPDACGECRSCHLIAAGTHPEVRVIAPLLKVGGQEEEVAADVYVEGTMIRTEQIGDLIRQAHMTMVEGRRKVLIVTRAEAMNEASANRLLKTLEEPPGAATFILTTPAPSQLLPTIQSRCQAVRFGPVADGAAVEGLRREFPDLPAERVRAAVALSGGRYGWAKRALASVSLLALRDELLELAASLPGRRLVESLRVAEGLSDLAERWWLASQDEEVGAELLKRSRDRVLRANVGEVLDVLLAWYRDLVLLGTGADASALANPDRAEALETAGASYSPAQAQAAAELCRDVKRYIQVGNANLRLALEVLATGLIESGRQQSVEVAQAAGRGA